MGLNIPNNTIPRTNIQPNNTQNIPEYKSKLKLFRFVVSRKRNNSLLYLSNESYNKKTNKFEIKDTGYTLAELIALEKKIFDYLNNLKLTYKSNIKINVDNDDLFLVSKTKVFTQNFKKYNNNYKSEYGNIKNLNNLKRNNIINNSNNNSRAFKKSINSCEYGANKANINEVTIDTHDNSFNTQNFPIIKNKNTKEYILFLNIFGIKYIVGYIRNFSKRTNNNTNAYMYKTIFNINDKNSINEINEEDATLKTFYNKYFNIPDISNNPTTQIGGIMDPITMYIMFVLIMIQYTIKLQILRDIKINKHTSLYTVLQITRKSIQINISNIVNKLITMYKCLNLELNSKEYNEHWNNLNAIIDKNYEDYDRLYRRTEFRRCLKYLTKNYIKKYNNNTNNNINNEKKSNSMNYVTPLNTNSMTLVNLKNATTESLKCIVDEIKYYY